MAIIKDLRGRTAVAEDGSVPGVVNALERMLSEAKEGKIRAFAAGIVRSDGTVSTKGYMVLDTLISTIGAVACLQYDLCKKSDEGDID